MHQPKKAIDSPQQFWTSLPESNKTISVIVGLNTLVFFGWRYVPLVMGRHFTHSPYTNNVYTMITSMFSHQSGAHFLFNMVALWSFGNPIHNVLGRENFLAFYLTSGVSASMTSHLFWALSRQAGVVSLGASGALFGLIGLVYERFPDASLALFFLFPFSAKSLIPCVAAFDFIGLTGVWTRVLGFALDHAAHLGGLWTGIVLSRTICHPYEGPKIYQNIENFKQKFLSKN